MAARKTGKMQVISKYFGKMPGQALKDVAAEIKQLDDDSKDELAIGAALNMGLTQDDVSFNLE